MKDKELEKVQRKMVGMVLGVGGTNDEGTSGTWTHITGRKKTPGGHAASIQNPSRQG